MYTLLTSTGSFDTGRAITNSVAIIVLGPAVLTTLRRAARRATVTGVVADLDRAPGAGAGPADDGRRERPRRYSMSRMRSSLAAGAPRPSRLLVVTHSRPSGATATVRIRP